MLSRDTCRVAWRSCLHTLTLHRPIIPQQKKPIPLWEVPHRQQIPPQVPKPPPAPPEEGLLGGCRPPAKDAGYFWQPPQLPALWQSRKGGREGRKEESTVAAQTTQANPWGLSAGMHAGKSQRPAGHLHPAATWPPALQRASPGNGGVKGSLSHTQL